MFLLSTEYALRAIICLAQNSEGPMTVAQVADKIRAPKNYLAKIINGLSKFDIVRSQRGPSGGFSLVADPDSLTLLHVMDAVSPLTRIYGCHSGDLAQEHPKCMLHLRLDSVIDSLRLSLSSITFSELLNDPQRLPLCDCECE